MNGRKGRRTKDLWTIWTEWTLWTNLVHTVHSVHIVHKSFVLVLFLFLPLCAVANPETVTKRMQAHLLIGDYQSAVAEGRQAITRYPDCQQLWEVYIASLGKAGDEQTMLQMTKRYFHSFPQACSNRQFLEKVAWSVLEIGANSSSPIIRLMSLLGAFFGQDSRGVAIIDQHLDDKNPHIRAVCVQIAGHLRDAKLLDHLRKLLHEEKVWSIKLEVIKALGKMKDRKVQPYLMNILMNEQTMAEEKLAAIEALVEMLDKITPEQLQKLTTAARSGLRELGCRAVLHLNLQEGVSLIEPLIDDPCSNVRIAALQTLGVVHKEVDRKRIVNKLQDPDQEVAINAAWLLTLTEPSLGQSYLKKWLTHRRQDVRLYATAALATTGVYGQPLMLEMVKTHSDPYVKLNLAVALLGQRSNTEQMTELLYEQFKNNSEKWSQQTAGIFQAIVPATMSKEAEIVDAETTNQMLRLELLNKMAIVGEAKAQLAMLEFLQHRNWGIAGSASALLLTEGDFSAVDLVRALLDHPKHHIRIQAALILALWGKDEQAITELQKSYPQADRELKEKILEGLGRISAESSIPFLLEQLQEPSQSLRIISASALLQCLYH